MIVFQIPRCSESYRLYEYYSTKKHPLLTDVPTHLHTLLNLLNKQKSNQTLQNKKMFNSQKEALQNALSHLFNKSTVLYAILSIPKSICIVKIVI